MNDFFQKVKQLKDHGDNEDDEQSPSDGLAGFAFLEDHVAEHEDG
jgi:hypothetical protein